MKKYDYLIVGAGLFGAVFAHEATRCGKTCLVIDRRDHIGGNIYTEEVEEFRYIVMVRIFSTLQESTYGSILISLRNLIILLILLSLFIRTSSTICRLI